MPVNMKRGYRYYRDMKWAAKRGLIPKADYYKAARFNSPWKRSKVYVPSERRTRRYNYLLSERVADQFELKALESYGIKNAYLGMKIRPGLLKRAVKHYLSTLSEEERRRAEQMAAGERPRYEPHPAIEQTQHGELLMRVSHLEDGIRALHERNQQLEQIIQKALFEGDKEEAARMYQELMAKQPTSLEEIGRQYQAELPREDIGTASWWAEFQKHYKESGGRLLLAPETPEQIDAVNTFLKLRAIERHPEIKESFERIVGRKATAERPVEEVERGVPQREETKEPTPFDIDLYKQGLLVVSPEEEEKIKQAIAEKRKPPAVAPEEKTIEERIAEAFKEQGIPLDEAIERIEEHAEKENVSHTEAIVALYPDIAKKVGLVAEKKEEKPAEAPALALPAPTFKSAVSEKVIKLVHDALNKKEFGKAERILRGYKDRIPDEDLRKIKEIIETQKPPKIDLSSPELKPIIEKLALGEKITPKDEYEEALIHNANVINWAASELEKGRRKGEVIRALVREKKEGKGHYVNFDTEHITKIVDLAEQLKEERAIDYEHPKVMEALDKWIRNKPILLDTTTVAGRRIAEKAALLHRVAEAFDKYNADPEAVKEWLVKQNRLSEDEARRVIDIVQKYRMEREPKKPEELTVEEANQSRDMINLANKIAAKGILRYAQRVGTLNLPVLVKEDREQMKKLLEEGINKSIPQMRNWDDVVQIADAIEKLKSAEKVLDIKLPYEDIAKKQMEIADAILKEAENYDVLKPEVEELKRRFEEIKQKSPEEAIAWMKLLNREIWNIEQAMRLGSTYGKELLSRDVVERIKQLTPEQPIETVEKDMKKQAKRLKKIEKPFVKWKVRTPELEIGEQKFKKITRFGFSRYLIVDKYGNKRVLTRREMKKLEADGKIPKGTLKTIEDNERYLELKKGSEGPDAMFQKISVPESFMDELPDELKEKAKKIEAYFTYDIITTADVTGTPTLKTVPRREVFVIDEKGVARSIEPTKELSDYLDEQMKLSPEERITNRLEEKFRRLPENYEEAREILLSDPEFKGWENTINRFIEEKRAQRAMRRERDKRAKNILSTHGLDIDGTHYEIDIQKNIEEPMFYRIDKDGKIVTVGREPHEVIPFPDVEETDDVLNIKHYIEAGDIERARAILEEAHSKPISREDYRKLL
ncbi:MAG: hypothetical protein J7K68_02590, partial [Candidatus Diapherotrites archaeon]|nr:hypothetical protein [Candidatus Diapherotrites archaeon]